MILEALIDFRERLEGQIIPAHHKKQRVQWILDVGGEGQFLGLVQTGSRKGDQKELISPYVRRAGTSPPPYLFVDKPDYVLGLDENSEREERTRQRHGEYIDLIRRAAVDTGIPEIRLFLGFLEEEGVESARSDPKTEAMKAGDLIAPRVDGVFLNEILEARSFWQNLQDQIAAQKSDIRAPCIVCGEEKAVARTHPVELKMGPNRVAMISGNEDAFLSYGLKQSEIAPMCHSCARKYGEALRFLMQEERYHLRLGPVTWMFWTREPVEWDFRNIVLQADVEAVRGFLASPLRGRRTALETNRFYALAGSANKSRMVVRSWLTLTLEDVYSNLKRYFEGQRIDRKNGEERLFGLWALAGGVVRKLDDISPRFYPALLEHALTGVPLPDWILHQAVQRARVAPADRIHPRAALIKLVLSSRPDRKERTMVDAQLTPGHPSLAYQCGRLFAVLDDIQRTAVSPKATIVDRYYGSASSTPASVFGLLTKRAQNHLGKIRKSRQGLYHHLDRLSGEIMSEIGAGAGFPRTLTLEEQGLFALGFYQQRYATKPEESTKEESTESKNVEATS